MQFNIKINQAYVFLAGFGDKTDLIDWAIVDYVASAGTGQLVWVNLKILASDMPIIGITTKGALSKRLSKLEKIGLITKDRDKNGNLFVSITDECLKIIR